MKDLIKIILAVVLAVSIILFGAYLSHKVDEKRVEKVEQLILEYMEKAYYEGQKDAIEGDIRIRKNGDDYEWIKSPLDSGLEPTYKGNIE